MKLITEEISGVQVITEKYKGKKRLCIEGTFLQGGIKNRNGRMYPIETLSREVGRYNESFIKKGINQHMPELMAILYRPVVEEAGNGIYTIEAYDGNIAIRAEQMKKMSAEEVQSALVFFYSFVKVLLMTLQSSLMKQMKQMHKQ